MNFSKYSNSFIESPYIINNPSPASQLLSFISHQKHKNEQTTPFTNIQMILNSSYSVKLPKKYKKILYLHASFKNTFVFLALIVQRKDGIVHVDNNGKVLFQHIFQHPMDTMGLLRDKEVILLQTRKNKITILDLETHEFSYFPHQFMSEESDQTEILTFSETKYLCIEEKGRYNDNRYKLNYFPYPLQQIDKKTKTVAIYEAKDNEWTYEHTTFKANNYSMMLWCKPRHDDSFEFKTYDIQEGKGQYRQYGFSDPLAAFGQMHKIETLIMNAWEMRKSNFIFLCLTDKEIKKTGGGSINSNFIVDVDNQGAISETKFTFGPYQDYLIDCYNLGPNSMFRTFKFEQGKTLKTPTYYIDNQTEIIMAEEPWECSHLYKYEFEGYSSGLLCQGMYENIDVDNFKVNLKRVAYPKQIYSFLLIEWSVELTQQLIEDVLSVLC